MALNTETQVNVSVILERELHARLKEYSRRNRRSISAQVALWVEQNLDREAPAEPALPEQTK
ncbi:MAG: hypothetical protein WCG31_11840 [Deltaproteobacteria bacterium]